MTELTPGDEVILGDDKYIVASSARACVNVGCGLPAIYPHEECEACRNRSGLNNESLEDFSKRLSAACRPHLKKQGDFWSDWAVITGRIIAGSPWLPPENKKSNEFARQQLRAKYGIDESSQSMTFVEFYAKYWKDRLE